MTWYTRFTEESINNMYKDISEAMKDAGINLEGKNVLIAGIGEGFELEKVPIVRDAFENNKAKFYAIDVKEVDFPGKDKVGFKNIDVRKISKDTFGKTFDVILLTNVIVYFANEDGIMTEKGYKNIEKTLENLYNILNKGGYLILTTEYMGRIIQEKDGRRDWRGLKRFLNLNRLEDIIEKIGFGIVLTRETSIEGRKREVEVFTYYPACPGMMMAASFYDMECEPEKWLEYEQNNIRIYVLRKT